MQTWQTFASEARLLQWCQALGSDPRDLAHVGNSRPVLTASMSILGVLADSELSFAPLLDQCIHGMISDTDALVTMRDLKPKVCSMWVIRACPDYLLPLARFSLGLLKFLGEGSGTWVMVFSMGLREVLAFRMRNLGDKVARGVISRDGPLWGQQT